MDFKKLFEHQKLLRDKIIKNHELEKDDLLENFIVAFQTELGELANEWRGFKHWSTNREMNRDKALEEFADCLAFLLELGLEIYFDYELWDLSDLGTNRNKTIQSQFIEFNKHLCQDFCEYDWVEIAELLIGLGYMLGFTKKEMIKAYYKKTEINHKRQENGY